MPYEDALAAFRRGDNAEAARQAALDVAEARASGDARTCVDGLCMLARVALREGDLAGVAAYAGAARQLARDAADEHLQRMPIHLLAVAARLAGRYDEGRELYLRSIALNDALGEAVMAGAEHRNLAYLELRAGNAGRARQLFEESVRRFDEVDAPAMRPYLTFDQATVAAMDGDYHAASGYLASAQAQWADQGTIPDPDDAAEIADLRRRLEAAAPGAEQP